VGFDAGFDADADADFDADPGSASEDDGGSAAEYSDDGSGYSDSDDCTSSVVSERERHREQEEAAAAEEAQARTKAEALRVFRAEQAQNEAEALRRRQQREARARSEAEALRQKHQRQARAQSEADALRHQQQQDETASRQQEADKRKRKLAAFLSGVAQRRPLSGTTAHNQLARAKVWDARPDVKEQLRAVEDAALAPPGWLRPAAPTIDLAKMRNMQGAAVCRWQWDGVEPPPLSMRSATGGSGGGVASLPPSGWPLEVHFDDDEPRNVVDVQTLKHAQYIIYPLSYPGEGRTNLEFWVEHCKRLRTIVCHLHGRSLVPVYVLHSQWPIDRSLWNKFFAERLGISHIHDATVNTDIKFTPYVVGGEHNTERSPERGAQALKRKLPPLAPLLSAKRIANAARVRAVPQQRE
jgi:hypothetical protein